MSKKGFTLIELLVVISIIALLLSILMPALTKVKEQARAVVCSTNLHQYGIAIAGYEADTGAFPHPSFWLSTTPVDPISNWGCVYHNPDHNMDGLLSSYLGDDNVHSCATWKSISIQEGCIAEGALAGVAPPHDPTIPIEPRFSYSMNAYLGAHGGPYPWIPLGSDSYTNFAAGTVGADLPFGGRMKPAQVMRPSATLLFTEEAPVDIPGLTQGVPWVTDNATFALGPVSGTGQRSFADYYRPSTPAVPGGGIGPYTGSIATIHKTKGGDITSGQGNVVMADGHTEMVNPWDDGGYINFSLMWPGKKPSKAFP